MACHLSKLSGRAGLDLQESGGLQRLLFVDMRLFEIACPAWIVLEDGALFNDETLEFLNAELG